MLAETACANGVQGTMLFWLLFVFSVGVGILYFHGLLSILSNEGEVSKTEGKLQFRSVQKKMSPNNATLQVSVRAEWLAIIVLDKQL